MQTEKPKNIVQSLELKACNIYGKSQAVLLQASTHLSNVLIEDAPEVDHIVGVHHEIDSLSLTNLDHTTEHCFIVVTRRQCGHCHGLYEGGGGVSTVQHDIVEALNFVNKFRTTHTVCQ